MNTFAKSAEKLPSAPPQLIQMAPASSDLIIHLLSLLFSGPKSSQWHPAASLMRIHLPAASSGCRLYAKVNRIAGIALPSSLTPHIPTPVSKHLLARERQVWSRRWNSDHSTKATV